MATRVPYSPIPTIPAQDRPTPYRSEAVPQGAFGQFQAAAEEHLGTTMEGVGNELMGRALAIQEMNQQAAANEAVATYQNQQISSYLDYTQKLGKDAVDGYSPFASSSEQLRQQVRGTLSSPYAQHLFDNESRSSQFRVLFSAGIHAKDQQQKYVIGASDARMAAADNSALSNPDDEQGFQAGLKTKEDEARQRGVILGWSQDQTNQFVADKKSELAFSRVQGLAKTQPLTAKKLLDQYSQQDLLTGADSTKLQAYVSSQIHNVQSRVTSSAILAGNGGQFGAGKVDIDLAAEAVASRESSGNWIGRHPPAPNGGHALGRYGIMNYNLGQWLHEAGMPQMTEDQFLADHDAQTQLFKFKFGQYMSQTGSFNGAARLWFGKGASDGTTTAPQYLTDLNAYLARHASESQLSSVSRQTAKDQVPDDPEYADRLEHEVMIKHADDLRMQKQDELTNFHTVAGALGPDKDGRVPTTLDDLLKNDEVKTAYDGLTKEDQNRVLKQMLANTKSGGYAFTPETQKDYTQIVGRFLDPNRSADDVQSLLGEDILGKPWPWAQKLEVMKMQQGLLKSQQAATSMARPLQVLATMMDNAGIRKPREGRDPDYDQFVGALHNIIQGYVQENGKKPSDDEVNAMGSRLLRDLTYQQQSYWFHPYKLYQATVPDQARSAIINNYRQRYGVDPDDDYIHNTYIAVQYQSIYGRRQRPPSGGGQ